MQPVWAAPSAQADDVAAVQLSTSWARLRSLTAIAAKACTAPRAVLRPRNDDPKLWGPSYTAKLALSTANPGPMVLETVILRK